MIPRVPVDVYVTLPGGALWLPDFEELDEDGFGFFHDKWLMVGVTEAAAADVLERESELLTEADARSGSPAEFDEVCTSLEMPEDDFEDGLGSLEIGVAGLSHVLNLVGGATSASCRGHAGPTAWTRRPVVYFAAERPWAELIRDIVATAGNCGLDASEEGLLMIWASSVADTAQLARELWNARAEFAVLGTSAFRRWAEEAGWLE